MEKTLLALCVKKIACDWGGLRAICDFLLCFDCLLNVYFPWDGDMLMPTTEALKKPFFQMFDLMHRILMPRYCPFWELDDGDGLCAVVMTVAELRMQAQSQAHGTMHRSDRSAAQQELRAIDDMRITVTMNASPGQDEVGLVIVAVAVSRGLGIDRVPSL